MTQFNFTDEFEDLVDFNSDSVDNVWYDEPTATVYVEWADSYNVYRYDGVPKSVVEDAVNADSVGRAVAKTIKQVYGPGTNLGEDTEPVERKANSTKEFSLQPPPVVNNYFTGDGQSNATTEYSLQTPAAPEKAKTGGLSLVDGDVVFTLYFTVDGDSQVRTHTLRNVENFDEAVDTLNSFAESAGLDLKIQEVRATFE